MAMCKKRRGKASRRQLEFDVIQYHIKKDKAGFIARLQRKLKPEGSCLIYTGQIAANGYGRDTFRFLGKRVTIDMHRLFLILKIGTPIPLEMEAGHREGCKARNCVRHVELQHYKENAVTNVKHEEDADIPF